MLPCGSWVHPTLSVVRVTYRNIPLWRCSPRFQTSLHLNTWTGTIPPDKICPFFCTEIHFAWVGSWGSLAHPAQVKQCYKHEPLSEVVSHPVLLERPKPSWRRLLVQPLGEEQLWPCLQQETAVHSTWPGIADSAPRPLLATEPTTFSRNVHQPRQPEPINKSDSIILYQNNILAFNECNCQYGESRVMNHYFLLPSTF